MAEPGERRRNVRLGLAALVVLGGLVVVALASGRAVWDTGGEVPATPSAMVYLRDALVGVGVVASAVVLTAALVELLRRRSGPRSAPKRRWWANIVAFAIISVLFLLLMALRNDGEETARNEATGAPVTTSTTVAEPPSAGGGYLPLLGGLGALVVVAALVATRFGRANAGEPAVEETATSGVAAALAEGVADLRDDPDPRRAILRTWERLEQVFDRHELGRRPQETTAELARRALGRLHASAESSSRLAGLVERAMYSAEPLDRNDQLAAIDAFEAVRADIRRHDPTPDDAPAGPAGVPATGLGGSTGGAHHD
ncbi:MAG: DUF4129 domain-containing protein [Actinomycetota bacterium]|nr:DUF4129 domain-containing protein [Actinomycetota bacterium]